MRRAWRVVGEQEAKSGEGETMTEQRDAGSVTMLAKPKPFAPTRARPGTLRKVAVLRRRALSGQPLWHPGDATLDNYARPEGAAADATIRWLASGVNFRDQGKPPVQRVDRRNATTPAVVARKPAKGRKVAVLHRLIKTSRYHAERLLCKLYLDGPATVETLALTCAMRTGDVRHALKQNYDWFVASVPDVHGVVQWGLKPAGVEAVLYG